MRIEGKFRIAAALIAASLAGPLAAADRPNFDRSYDRPAASLAAGSESGAPGAVASRLSPDGPATFIWSGGAEMRAAAGSTAEQAARRYLALHAAHWGVGVGDLATLELTRIHDTGRGGILAVFHQRVQGLRVENARVSVMMKRDLSLVAIGGAVVPAAVAGKGSAPAGFRYTAEEALVAAFDDLFQMNSRGSWTNGGMNGEAKVFQLTAAAEAAVDVSLWAPSRAWQVWYSMPEGLVPAWKVEILATERAGDASFEHVVNASDNSFLRRRNLTADLGEAPTSGGYNYRVWADAATKNPLDGPIADLTPHPTGLPDGTPVPYIASSYFFMDGFNQTLDPWLPIGATVTTGNNVDAYADLVTPDGFTNPGDMRAAVVGGNLDYTYDTSVGAAANATQIQGAVVNLFYVTNWLHDYFYDSGFNELAANAQSNNFGRGGQGGDPIHAESDDFGGTNNANMATPADGLSPRMQMFKWTRGVATLTRLDPDPDTNMVARYSGGFGPANYDFPGELVLGTYGAGVTDGCSAATNSVAGKIKLVDRGNCTFLQKAQVATTDNAIGVIIANNINDGSQSAMGGGAGENTVAAMGINFADGATLKTNLSNGVVNMNMKKEAQPLSSGSLDNQIVAHEWGHYFHHRLQSCGSAQCGAQSEGWGDWVALHMTVEDGDSYGGVFAAAIYATADNNPNNAYFGIRRFPYSTDFTKNGLMFRHITDGETLPAVPTNVNGIANSESHNAGEVWASMMFEAYVALLTDPPALAPTGDPRLTWAEARRRIADYAVAGLQLTPIDSTFTETRDGVLAAAAAEDEADFLAIAEAFATRGSGTCAVAPARDSTTFTGVVESVSLAGRLVVGNGGIEDDIVACDDDNFLDPTETGTLAIDVTNLGPAVLNGATVQVSSNNAHVTFPGGNNDVIDPIGFGELASASFQVAADAGTLALSTVTVTVTANHANTCGGAVVATKTFRLAADEFASGVDGVDGFSGNPWGQTGESGIWDRVTTAGNTVWHGLDVSGVTDSQLVSDPMTVNATGNFILELDHRYQFEADSVFWDGGVIEYSTDNGANWNDVDDLVALPYDGVITDQASNPLMNRAAFSGSSSGYPAMSHLVINFGTQLASQSVRFRFRIGTDEATSAPGWDIDNIAVTNVAAPPFTGVAGDTSCATTVIFADGFASGNPWAWSAKVP